MADYFVALPVGRGDAFFYQKDDLKILVDGGNSTNDLPRLVNEHLGIKEIDIVICTHNDADHTNGLIGILDKEKWEGTIHEVWLPGSWSYKLKELLEDPDSFFIELAEDISQLPIEKLFSLENLTILTTHDFECVHQNEEVSNELFVVLCNEGEEFSYKFYSHLLRILKPRSRLFQKTRQHLCLEAIDAALRIKKIAHLAYSRGLKVRWFDFNEFELQDQQPYGGNKGILEPVNAREVLPITRRITALQYLYLTVDNKRSLAFLSPEEDNRPGVLFTAESDFNFQIRHQAPSLSMVVTAPHHGSENNRTAYKAISNWHTCPASLIWVRSDAEYKKRKAGASFLSVSGQRLCTTCRPLDPNYLKQAVKLFWQQGSSQWVFGQGVRTCQCQ